ncbi:MAG: hypothetical protein WCO28_08180 [Bacteroidota bacterium]
MEDEIIAEFNDNSGFNVKLTNERIYLKSAISEETFALRGVHGVGIYDDVEKLEKELEAYNLLLKQGDVSKYVIMALGVFSIIGSLFVISEEQSAGGPIFLILSLFICYIGYNFKNPQLKKITKPELTSYFRLMLAGGDRKFLFNKNKETSIRIADFINKVEATLTSYK